MASALLADRLGQEFRQIVDDLSPGTPRDIADIRAGLYLSRAVQSLRGYLSELAADAAQRNDIPKANAYLDVFEELGPA